MNLLDFKEPLATIAAFCTILQFLAGVLVCKKFYKTGTVGDTSAFPFIAGFLSCSLWLRYGHLLNDNSVIITNIVGAFLQFSYVICYTIYTTRKISVLRQFLAVCFALLLIITYMQYMPDNTTAKAHLGFICCCVTIVFFAAPFATLAHVIKVKSTESLPFSMIVANTIVSAEWMTYGFIIDDAYVEITNSLGCIISGIQLSLFLKYPSTPSKGGKNIGMI
ncbi:sugar transporter SWEET1 [Neocloeon triangulifer]|uniref:sugar transporter SWEET1 n=1 Tax=Neocloeon triangulifer TaxID=2078957 RepID=UPI00286F7446|nr:sugar transporter SWEET1 [Neocloeon triangulifer]